MVNLFAPIARGLGGVMLKTPLITFSFTDREYENIYIKLIKIFQRHKSRFIIKVRSQTLSIPREQVTIGLSIAISKGATVADSYAITLISLSNERFDGLKFKF